MVREAALGQRTGFTRPFMCSEVLMRHLVHTVVVTATLTVITGVGPQATAAPTLPSQASDSASVADAGRPDPGEPRLRPLGWLCRLTRLC